MATDPATKALKDLRWLGEHAGPIMNQCAPNHWQPGQHIVDCLLQDEGIKRPQGAVWHLAVYGVDPGGLFVALARARRRVEVASRGDLVCREGVRDG